MGRDYVLTWEIVEHDPPSRQTIESTSGPFATTLAYRLSPQDGGTLIRRFEVDVVTLNPVVQSTRYDTYAAQWRDSNRLAPSRRPWPAKAKRCCG